MTQAPQQPQTDAHEPASVSRNREVQARLGRLLAEENLIFQFRNVPTAYMDVQSRILTMPIFSSRLSSSVVAMLIGHEVGHSRFTPAIGWHNEVAPVQPSGKRRFNAVRKDYLNVLEDVRIERLIQRLYPGIRKDFVKGYRELFDFGFFGDPTVLEASLDRMPLIDRINVGWKCAGIVWLDLQGEENTFFQRAKTTETWEEVVELATDIMEHERKKAAAEKKAKEQKIDHKKVMDDLEKSVGKREERMSDIEEDEDILDDNLTDEQRRDREEAMSNDDDEDSEDSVETEKGESSSEADENEEDGDADADDERGNGSSLDNDMQEMPEAAEELIPESQTDQAFRKSEGALTESGAKHEPRVFILDRTMVPSVNEFLVSYKDLIARFDTVCRNEYGYGDTSLNEELVRDYGKVRERHAPFVNHLARLFEIKKRAWMHTRTGEHKTGMLNLAKAHQYRYNDDIFKKILEVPKGKNHAMVMYIDLSGSMRERLTGVMEQAVALAMFCRRLNIPFRVYGFTTNGSARYSDRYVSSKMTDTTRDRLTESYKALSGSLNGAAEKYLNPEFGGMLLLEMFSEKMTAAEFARMTVYCTTRVSSMFFGSYAPVGMNSTPLTEALLTIPEISAALKKAGVQKTTFMVLTDGGDSSHAFIDYAGGYVNRQYFLRVPYLSKSDYYIGESMSDIAANRATIKMIREVTGDTVLGYFICDKRTASNKIAQLHAYKAIVGSREAAVAEFATIGIYSVTNAGYNEFYLLNQTALARRAPKLEETNKSTVKGLTNAFTVSQTGNRASREFLNRFSERIS